MIAATSLHIIFYVFAFVAVCSAISVVTVRNPVRSVLSLVVTFFAMAGIWMLLRAEFLSLILVLVYVGAVMTLFLFVIMMLNVDRENKSSGFVRYFPVTLVVALVLTALMIASVGPTYFGLSQMPVPAQEPADYSNTAQLGTLLFTEYNYPFEIAGVILLVAMIAAITLSYHKPRRKVQTPGKQVAVQPKDRLRIVKMAPTPRKPKNDTNEHGE